MHCGMVLDAKRGRLFLALCVLSLVAPGALATAANSAAAAASSSGSEAEATPVAKVVKLLKEMQETVQKEGEEDEEMYDKLMCWCSTNEKAKTAAIEQAESTISELEASVEELTATIDRLTEDIKKTSQELADDTQALNEATELRQKQQKEFHGYELDAIQNVENLKAAIVVLGKHHSAAFPQRTALMQVLEKASGAPASLLQERSRLRARVREHAASRAKGDLDHETRQMDRWMRENDLAVDGDAAVDASSAEADKATEAFLQRNDQGDDAQPQAHSAAAVGGFTVEEARVLLKARRSLLAFAPQDRLEALGLVDTGNADSLPSQPYAAQSGEILGMLKQMKETMEKKLTEEQATEKGRASEFVELRDAKEEEIAEAERIVEAKTAENAEAGQKLADAKEDLANTRDNLDADQKFMVNLKKMCKEADAQWEIRRKTRSQEAIAIAETIEILTGDEARDTMNRSFNKDDAAAALLQTKLTTSAHARNRAKAAALLRRAAKSAEDDDVLAGLPSLSLTTLASAVQLNAFTEVKKAMDDMIADLKQQQEDEVKKKDYCTEALQENEMTTMKTEDLSKDLETKVEDLTATIEELTKGIEAAKAAVADTQVNQQRANENRVKENQDFQRTIADAAATEEILHKALNRLAQFYDSEFLQTKQSMSRRGEHAEKGHKKKQQPPVPLDGAGYSKSAGSGGVMSMIEKLIQDAREMGKEARADEQEAQIDYEEFSADCSETLEKLGKEIVNKSESVSKRKKEKIETEESQQATLQELEELSKEKGNLHKECDFVMKNFDIRQKARGEEIESIQQAKQILSGAQ